METVGGGDDVGGVRCYYHSEESIKNLPGRFLGGREEAISRAPG
jgi:hypothetical protein